MPTLDEATISELIANGESVDVEFKGDHPKLSDGKLAETVACLANRPGDSAGYLFVGVENNRRVTGHQPRHGRATEPNRIAALIRHNTIPPVTPEVTTAVVEGETVLAIQVLPSPIPVCTRSGVFKRRGLRGDATPECMPFTYMETQSHLAAKGASDITSLPIPELRFEDLNPLEIVRYRQMVQDNAHRSDEALLELDDLDLCKAIQAVEVSGDAVIVRTLGLLLFGYSATLQDLLPTHEIAFQQSNGLQLRQNSFVRWPLLEVMERVDSIIVARHQEDELMIGMRRHPIPVYDPAALREAVANALIHRDYARMGTVHVQWADDRFRVTNPGSFPEGITADNCLVTGPKYRNPLLADAFKRAGLVERRARGIPSIFANQLRHGRPRPQYTADDPYSVVLDLPFGPTNLNMVRIAERERAQRRPLTVSELLILDTIFSDRQIQLDTAMSVTQTSNQDALRVLLQLEQYGILESDQSLPNDQRHWAFARGLLDEADQSTVIGSSETNLTRTSDNGTSDLHDAEVLKHLISAGKVSRKEVIELCQITPKAATRVLQRLVDNGQIERHGSKRGTWYSLLRP